MSTKELRWLFLAVFAVAFFVSLVIEPLTLGVSLEWSNGNYRFAAGTHPSLLLLALIIWGLYLLLMHSTPASAGKPLPGVFRRFVAFFLDFYLALMAIAPVVGILPAILEWRRTGDFQWNFERITPAPADGWLSSAGFVLSLALLVSYFVLPVIRRRPSPGSCIVSYQIIPDDGVTITFRMALLRMLLGFIAACSAYLAPFIARDRKKGKVWFDKVCGTRAVILK